MSEAEPPEAAATAPEPPATIAMAPVKNKGLAAKSPKASPMKALEASPTEAPAAKAQAKSSQKKEERKADGKAKHKKEEDNADGTAEGKAANSKSRKFAPPAEGYQGHILKAMQAAKQPKVAKSNK